MVGLELDLEHGPFARRMASYGCARWEWLPSGCPDAAPDAAPRPLQLVESYDTSIPMLVEALRRHGCCLAVAGTMEAAGREREGAAAGLAGEGFSETADAPTQRKGGEAPRRGGRRGVVF